MSEVAVGSPMVRVNDSVGVVVLERIGLVAEEEEAAAAESGEHQQGAAETF